MSQHQCYAGLPLVSVIVPAYNAAKYIKWTLQSILAQTYTNLEVLVIDDGSQDQTADIVRQFAIYDSRIKLLQQPNAGVAAARNLGIEKTKGEFIAPIDADDIWFPTNLEKQVKRMIATGSAVGLVYSWSLDIDRNGHLTGIFKGAAIEGDVYGTLVCNYFLGNASCALIRRSCLDKVGKYNCDLINRGAQGCEDWELALRLSEKCQFKAVREFLVCYRVMPGTMSRNYRNMARSHSLVLDIVAQRHPDLPSIIYRLSKSNLYLHFSRLSYLRQDYHESLFWIKEMLDIDCFALLTRFQIYSITLLSLVKLAFPQLSNHIKTEPSYPSPPKLAEIQQKKLQIFIMLTTNSLFHQTITLLGIKQSFALENTRYERIGY